MKKDEGVKSVSKAVKILLAFTNDKPEWGIRELAENFQMQPSTVYRLLIPLEKEGIIEQDPKTKQYRLGLRLLSIANVVELNTEVNTIAKPFMKELVKDQNETAYLGILSNDRVFYTLVVESDMTMRVTVEVGQSRPLHTTATGKVFLLNMEEHQLKKYLNTYRKVERTEYTIIDAYKLKRNLESFRELGYCYTWEEHNIGIASVAAPIKNRLGNVIAALALSGPTVRMTEDRLPFIGEKVKDTALQISRGLGFRV